MKFFNVLLVITMSWLTSISQAQIPPSIYGQEAKRAESLIHKIDAKLSLDGIQGRNQDPALQRAVIAMNFEFENLFPMLFDHIRNLHESALGWGDTDSEARLAVEQKIAGLKLDGEGLSVRDKLLLPKYAYLIPEGKLSLAEHGYGGAFFIMKEGVKKRATWTTADSLGLERISAERAFLEGTLNTFSHSNSDLNRKPFTKAQNRSSHYLEVQIWGPLNSNDVAEVVLPNPFVIEDFLKPYIQGILKKLIDSKIPISLFSDDGGRSDEALLKRIKYTAGEYPDALKIIDTHEYDKRNPGLIPQNHRQFEEARRKAGEEYLKTKVFPFLDLAPVGDKPKCSSVFKTSKL